MELVISMLHFRVLAPLGRQKRWKSNNLKCHLNLINILCLSFLLINYFANSELIELENIISN